MIAMDFAKLPEVDTADAFEDYILDLCRPYGFTYKGFETFKLFALDSWLSQQPNRSVVFLIDNYDVPLLRSKHDKALFKCIGNTLNEFFAILKSCNSAIRFLFLTGITALMVLANRRSLRQLRSSSFLPLKTTRLGLIGRSVTTRLNRSFLTAVSVAGVEHSPF